MADTSQMQGVGRNVAAEASKIGTENEKKQVEEMQAIMANKGRIVSRASIAELKQSVRDIQSELKSAEVNLVKLTESRQRLNSSFSRSNLLTSSQSWHVQSTKQLLESEQDMWGLPLSGNSSDSDDPNVSYSDKLQLTKRQLSQDLPQRNISPTIGEDELTNDEVRELASMKLSRSRRMSLSTASMNRKRIRLPAGLRRDTEAQVLDAPVQLGSKSAESEGSLLKKDKSEQSRSEKERKAFRKALTKPTGAAVKSSQASGELSSTFVNAGGSAKGSISLLSAPTSKEKGRSTNFNDRNLDFIAEREERPSTYVVSTIDSTDSKEQGTLKDDAVNIPDGTVKAETGGRAATHSNNIVVAGKEVYTPLGGPDQNTERQMMSTPNLGGAVDTGRNLRSPFGPKRRSYPGKYDRTYRSAMFLDDSGPNSSLWPFLPAPITGTTSDVTELDSQGGDSVNESITTGDGEGTFSSVDQPVSTEQRDEQVIVQPRERRQSMPDRKTMSSPGPVFAEPTPESHVEASFNKARSMSIITPQKFHVPRAELSGFLTQAIDEEAHAEGPNMTEDEISQDVFKGPNNPISRAHPGSMQLGEGEEWNTTSVLVTSRNTHSLQSVRTQSSTHIIARSSSISGTHPLEFPSRDTFFFTGADSPMFESASIITSDNLGSQGVESSVDLETIPGQAENLNLNEDHISRVDNLEHVDEHQKTFLEQYGHYDISGEQAVFRKLLFDSLSLHRQHGMHKYDQRTRSARHISIVSVNNQYDYVTYEPGQRKRSYPLKDLVWTGQFLEGAAEDIFDTTPITVETREQLVEADQRKRPLSAKSQRSNATEGSIKIPGEIDFSLGVDTDENELKAGIPRVIEDMTSKVRFEVSTSQDKMLPPVMSTKMEQGSAKKLTVRSDSACRPNSSRALLRLFTAVPTPQLPKLPSDTPEITKDEEFPRPKSAVVTKLKNPISRPISSKRPVSAFITPKPGVSKINMLEQARIKTVYRVGSSQPLRQTETTINQAKELGRPAFEDPLDSPWISSDISEADSIERNQQILEAIRKLSRGTFTPDLPKMRLDDRISTEKRTNRQNMNPTTIGIASLDQETSPTSNLSRRTQFGHRTLFAKSDGWSGDFDDVDGEDVVFFQDGPPQCITDLFKEASSLHQPQHHDREARRQNSARSHGRSVLDGDSSVGPWAETFKQSRSPTSNIKFDTSMEEPNMHQQQVELGLQQTLIVNFQGIPPADLIPVILPLEDIKPQPIKKAYTVIGAAKKTKKKKKKAKKKKSPVIEEPEEVSEPEVSWSQELVRAPSIESIATADSSVDMSQVEDYDENGLLKIKKDPDWETAISAGLTNQDPGSESIAGVLLDGITGEPKEPEIFISHVETPSFWVEIGIMAAVRVQNLIRKLQQIFVHSCRKSLFDDVVIYCQRLFRARRVSLQYKTVISIKKSGRNIKLALKLLEKLEDSAWISESGEHRSAKKSIFTSLVRRSVAANRHGSESAIPWLDDSLADIDTSNAPSDFNPVRNRIRKTVQRYLQHKTPLPTISTDRVQLWRRFVDITKRLEHKFPNTFEQWRQVPDSDLSECLNENLDTRIQEIDEREENSDSQDDVEEDGHVRDINITVTIPPSDALHREIHSAGPQQTQRSVSVFVKPVNSSTRPSTASQAQSGRNSSSARQSRSKSVMNPTEFQRLSTSARDKSRSVVASNQLPQAMDERETHRTSISAGLRLSANRNSASSGRSRPVSVFEPSPPPETREERIERLRLESLKRKTDRRLDRRTRRAKLRKREMKERIRNGLVEIKDRVCADAVVILLEKGLLEPKVVVVV
ncbi:hypothetical protein HDU76_010747 [Blyttiomyces sp. JEL0837]|nr:hypothetical protein HDU76_010747 [Blyttiomyces sp. JEL0837]